MDEVQVVVAHAERATSRVGDVFLKGDADRARIDAECRLLVANGVLPADLVVRDCRVAEAALRP